MPHLTSVSCDQAKAGYGDGAILSLSESGNLAYEGREIKIEPAARGKRYRFTASYSVSGYPIPGFYMQFFKYPTVGVSLSL